MSKSKYIKIRCTAAEKFSAWQRARQCGLSLSEYSRRRLLGGRVPGVNPEIVKAFVLFNNTLEAVYKLELSRFSTAPETAEIIGMLLDLALALRPAAGLRPRK